MSESVKSRVASAFSNDPFYMRVKDAMLIILAMVVTLSAFFPGMVPFLDRSDDEKVMIVRRDLDERSKKYIPMIERHESEIKVMRSQYNNVQEQLKSIDKKLDRIIWRTRGGQ